MLQRWSIDITNFKQGFQSHLSEQQMTPDASPDTSNLELWRGVLRETRGVRQFATVGKPSLLFVKALNSAQQAVALLVVSDGIYLYSFTDNSLTKLYTYGTGVIRPVWSVVVQGLTGPQTLITDLENVVVSYDGSVVTSLAGSPPRARFIDVFYNFTLLIYTLEGGVTSPYRVQWSDIGDPTNWVTGLSGFVDLADTPDYAQVGSALNDRYLVYKDTTIWEMTYVGYPKIFNFAKVSDRVGIKAPKTLKVINNLHYFLGTDNVYTFDGRTLTSISDTIYPSLYGDDRLVDENYLSKAMATYYPGMNEYWLFVTPIGSESNSLILRYSIDNKKWWIKRFDTLYPSCVGFWDQQVASKWLAAWLTFTDTWNDHNEAWLDASSEAPFGGRMPLLGYYTNDLNYIGVLEPTAVTDSGIVPTMYWTTPELCPSKVTNALTVDRTPTGSALRFTTVMFEARGEGTLQVEYSVDEGATWTTINTRAFVSSWSWLRYSCDVTSENLKLRLTPIGTFEIRQGRVLHTERTR